jgi:hypothetical protein
MSNPLYLSAADLGESRLALTLGQGYPTSIKAKVGNEEKEFPVSYWRKDAIACGKYKHPTTGQTLDVDAKRIDAWVEKFNAMRAANREIPAPATHSDDPRDNLGYVIGAARNGDKLQLTLQVIGEDGAAVAARNSCSICIDPDYKDETGKSWGEAIVHSAFTPKPVISGMGSFVPFAASRTGEPEVPIYYLAANCGTGAGGFKQGNTCAKGGAGSLPQSAGEIDSWMEARAKELGISKKEFTTTDEYRQAYPHIKTLYTTAKAAHKEAVSMVDVVKRENGKYVVQLPKERMGKTWGAKGAERTLPGYLGTGGDSMSGGIAEFDTFGQAAEYAKKHGYKVRKQSLSRSTSMDEAQLQTIGDLLGADDVTEETALPQLIEWGKRQGAEKKTALSRAEAAESKVKELEKVNLSRQPAKPTPTEIFYAAKYARGMRDEAIKAGAITPAIADAAEKRFMAKAVEADKITLSRAVEDDDHKLTEGFAKLIDFYEVVKDNKPAPAQGTQTPVQLARAVPGGDPTADDKLMDEGQKQAKAYTDQFLASRGVVAAK